MEPRKLWGDYSSDSDHEDLEEPCHMYGEIEEIPEVGTTPEAPQGDSGTSEQPLHVLIKRVAEVVKNRRIKTTSSQNSQKRTKHQDKSITKRRSSQKRTKHQDKSKGSKGYIPTLHQETQKKMRRRHTNQNRRITPLGR
ncbi:hypothetical protein LIER_22774 [Lithospermum erythrorhizon]|uniref:Uncharacterized protein n=1 Tax=Lithospermum erythrorhizon TaxID=34254 RepID=A0AAV3QWL4_LITER